MFTRVSTKEMFSNLIDKLRDALIHAQRLDILPDDVREYLEDLTVAVESPVYSKNGNIARGRVAEEFVRQKWTLDDYYQAFDPSFDPNLPPGDSSSRNIGVPLTVMGQTLSHVRESADLTEEDWASAEGKFVASFIAAVSTACYQASAAGLYGVPSRNQARPHLRLLPTPVAEVQESSPSLHSVLHAVI